MENRIAILDSLLTDEDREQLSDIYEPREVARSCLGRLSLALCDA